MSINLWENEPPYHDSVVQNENNHGTPSLTPYLLNDGEKCGCVIVCPGGGYSHRAAHEGEPVARWLNSIGISAFVLNYRVYPYKYPAPISDAQRAVRHVRYNCDKYNICPDRIGILGFSAGGHLAGCAAALYDKELYAPADAVDNVSARPDAAVLCYPVVSMSKAFAHAGSIRNLLGESPSAELLCMLSGEENAHSGMPPVFMWHTAADASVPVENTLELAKALHRNNVPFEYHIFNEGKHGIGLGGDMPLTSQWSSLCAEWLRHAGI